MKKVIALLSLLILLASTIGCGLLGVRVRDRSVEFYQVEKVGDGTDAFIVDASHIPANAIEQKDEFSRSGPVTKIKIREGYPVRLVIMPATRPSPATQSD